jgi:hypothetical protein
MKENDTRVTEAVAGYRKLATDLVAEWGDLASSIADKIDEDAYDGKAMRDAWLEAARLSVWTTYLMWNEAADAVAALSYRPGERYHLSSDPFESPLAGATLTVNGPLVGQQSRGMLIAKVDPSKLEAGEKTFTLYADVTGSDGDTYLGTVLAARGRESESVPVFITVE